MNKNNYFVYRHRRLDNYKVFYIGICKNKRRPYEKRHRNKYWESITKKTDYSIEIIAKVDKWEYACELEMFLIKEYGRKQLKTGSLCNMTDGGEGVIGYKYSEEFKQKLSKVHKGKKLSEKHKKIISERHKGKKLTEEQKQKISLANSRPSHRKGKTITKEHKQKIRKSLIGHKHKEETKIKMSNFYKNKRIGNGKYPDKKVIDTLTNIIYSSIAECSRKNNIQYQTLYMRIKRGKSNFKIYSD